MFSKGGQCLIYLEILLQALEDAKKSIELDPSFLEGYVCNAKVQFLMENYEMLWKLTWWVRGMTQTIWKYLVAFLILENG